MIWSCTSSQSDSPFSASHVERIRRGGQSTSTRSADAADGSPHGLQIAWIRVLRGHLVGSPTKMERRPGQYCLRGFSRDVAE